MDGHPQAAIGPGEHIELWADFRQLPVGEEVKLQNLTFSGVEVGMFMGGMRMEMEHTDALPNGAPFDVLTVRAEHTETETLTLPAQLAPLTRLRTEEAVNANQPRPFAISMAGGTWLLNGKSFIMDERVRIALRFADYAGRYLVHCHNLEHENQGMMRNFRIQAA
jgi:FtsP/CotA-like multicopper oxidase with cupredoxin domain